MEYRNEMDPGGHTEHAKVLEGLRREIQQLLKDRDVSGAREVEVYIGADGKSLCVNVDGKCHLRIGRIWGGIVINDMRASEGSMT